ncbi:MAG: hypothetical protein ACTSRZ_03190 [Promethearchaeota archaeon]
MAELKNELIDIRVICPKCKKDEFIQVDIGKIKASKKGVTAILIPSNAICEHSFQIFVDKNGAVRGYETPDFELQITLSETEHEVEEIVSANNFEVAKSLLGDEIFYKMLRSCFRGYEIFCISDNQSIRDYTQEILKNSFNEYCPKIYVATIEDYNSLYSKLIYASEHKNSFVFNADIPVIIKQIFKPGFKKKDFDFEVSFVNYCENKTNDLEKIAEEFRECVNWLFKSIEQVKEQIEKGKITGSKAVEKYMKKAMPAEIKIDSVVVYEILMNRYNYDMNKKFSLGLFY